MTSSPDPIDLRGLPPPEPLVRILAAIADGPEAPVVFLLSREPLPLYGMLRQAKLRFRVQHLDTGIEIRIERGERIP